MSLEIPSLCKRRSTVSTDEWPLAQMNCVHMHLQVPVSLEKLPTGDALERLLLEMDRLVVPQHVGLVVEDFAARRVCARNLLAQMNRAIMIHHVTLERK